MNTVLIDTLLSLIPSTFKIFYQQERMMDPNTVFRQCFNWFISKYGRTSAEDRETNQRAMAANWHPSMGFEVLTSHLFRGITFASLSRHPITDKDTVDIGVRVLNRTGLFGEEYKAWILQGDNPNNAIDFAAFKSFWENAVQIAAFTSVPASRHGYGMAVTDDDTSAWMRFPTSARHTPPPKKHSDPTRPISQRSKGNSKCSAKLSAMASPPRVSSTINSAHVADAAVDNNTVATMVVVAATVAVATAVVVVTTTVATRP